MSLGIVFFSNNCPHSRRFMQLLEAKPDLSSRFVKTDKQEDFKEHGVQYTPSIKLPDGTIKTGQEAFAFIGESPNGQRNDVAPHGVGGSNTILGLSLKTWLIIAALLLGALYLVKKFGLFGGSVQNQAV